MVKKFDEIKEAISATSTPVKLKERDYKIIHGASHESLDSMTDGSLQDRNEPLKVSGLYHWTPYFANKKYSLCEKDIEVLDLEVLETQNGLEVLVLNLVC